MVVSNECVTDSSCALTTLDLAEHRYSTVHELHVMLFLIACIHILYVTLSLGLCEIAVRIAADPSAPAPRLRLGSLASFVYWFEP